MKELDYIISQPYRLQRFSVLKGFKRHWVDVLKSYLKKKAGS